MTLPEHLGGHQGKTHIDAGALRYVLEKFNIGSMLDIGCGPGDMVWLARKWDIEAYGIDGDWTIKDDLVLTWDYTNGPREDSRTYDFAWSVEFLEHVEERFIPNYMADFQRCKYALVTYAPPGKGGHHHVNCRKAAYWIGVFEEHGFRLGFDETLETRRNSTMRKPFMQQHGLFFFNEALR